MENRELKRIIQDAAEDLGYKGVMELTDACDLSYERVSRVYGGSTLAKLSDVAHVASVLGLKIKFVNKLGEE
ncbi:MAG TPA: hypothetical protein EYN54_02060 [Methylococcaceae bacterium]|nr:hypothetical protein [Methylococcaceae bacterium]